MAGILIRPALLALLLLSAVAPSLGRANEPELISVPAFADVQPSNGASGHARASSSLGIVVFESRSENLVLDDANLHQDVFVRDQLGVRLVSRSSGMPANADSSLPDVSSDGSRIVFESDASNLVPGDSNGVSDIFLFDVPTGQMSRIVPKSGQANARSYAPRISADGHRIVFLSAASNWLDADFNGLDDAILFDLESGQAMLASRSYLGGQISDLPVLAPRISPDGRCISFQSKSAQISVDDSNGKLDGFIFDSQSLQTIRVTASLDGRESSYLTQESDELLNCSKLLFAGNYYNASGYHGPIFLYDTGSLIELPIPFTFGNSALAVSRNGRHLFIGDEVLAGKPAYQARVDLETMQVAMWNTGPGRPMAISDDGFQTLSLLLTPAAPEDRNVATDIQQRNVATNQTTWLSSASLLQPSTLAANGASGIGHGVYFPEAAAPRQARLGFSADGRYVLFSSLASNLILDDRNHVEDVFVRDRVLGLTARVSLRPDGSETGQASAASDISANGHKVVFESCDAMDLPSAQTVCDVYVRDLQNGHVEQVNVSSDEVPANQGGYSSRGHQARISGDGQIIVFASRATNLVPGGSGSPAGVFLRDLSAGTTAFLGTGAFPAISANGRFVVWGQLGVGIGLLDRQSNEIISLPIQGGTQVGGSGTSYAPTVSDSGRFVAYTSSLNGLVPDDTDFKSDLFVFDRQTGLNQRISKREGDTGGFNSVGVGEISADGRRVLYSIFATTPNFETLDYKLALFDRELGTDIRFSGEGLLRFTDGAGLTSRLSADGQHVLFAANLDGGSQRDRTGWMLDIWTGRVDAGAVFADEFE